jgi:hypothetical protein
MATVVAVPLLVQATLADRERKGFQSPSISLSFPRSRR